MSCQYDETIKTEVMTNKEISTIVEAASQYLYFEKMAQRNVVYNITDEDIEMGTFDKQQAQYEYWNNKCAEVVKYETADGRISIEDFISIINLVSEYGAGTAANMVASKIAA